MLGWVLNVWNRLQRPGVLAVPARSKGAGDNPLYDGLRQALDDGEFELHYQPIVDLVSRQWLGAEALCRWHRGDGRLIQPKDFIPQAERSGLITELGAWVIARAARDHLDMKAQGLAQSFYVSVNVAVPQLVEWDALHRALDDAHAMGANIRLELTGSVEVGPDALMSQFEALRAAGTFIGLDDFGPASQCSQLGGLPLSTLKLDQSLLTRAREPAGHERLAGLAAVARGLGLEVVAEGIEQEAQVNLLLGLGLTMGQGFLFARPRPYDDFCAALRTVGALPLVRSAVDRLRAQPFRGS